MIWQDLIKTALLGTERSQLAKETLEFLEGQGIATDISAQEKVLKGAAALHLLRKAGFQLEKFEGEITPANLEAPEKQCGNISGKHLGLILDGSYPNAFEEFISLLSKKEKTLAADKLPLVFDNCLADQLLWEKVVPVMGERGKWLLSQNPTWQWSLDKFEVLKEKTLEANKDLPLVDTAALGFSKKEKSFLKENLADVNSMEGIVRLWIEHPPHFKLKIKQIKDLSAGLSPDVFNDICLSQLTKFRGQIVDKEPFSLLLMHGETSWSKQLLSGFMDSYLKRMEQRSGYAFPRHYTRILENAAYRCDAFFAVSMHQSWTPFFGYANSSAKTLDKFFDIVAFRKKMRAGLLR